MPKFLRRGVRASRARTKGDKATFGDRSSWERVARERVEDDRLRLRGGSSAGHVMFGSGRLTLKNTCDMTTRRVLAARGGGSMLYGIIAAFGGRILQETVSVTLDDNSNHSIVCARAPERPSSTR